MTSLTGMGIWPSRARAPRPGRLALPFIVAPLVIALVVLLERSGLDWAALLVGLIFIIGSGIYALGPDLFRPKGSAHSSEFL